MTRSETPLSLLVYLPGLNAEVVLGRVLFRIYVNHVLHKRDVCPLEVLTDFDDLNPLTPYPLFLSNRIL